ncbi:hypothetical protein F4821DRAFT_68281 [Hypoxylon rubiginosum]|uniref:Uncharacterized protein n=1 Tax=Hypoxylon rubiginosum TaxID=110542 RepID=A0ACC0CIQ4_9PEZI|nr:hypothetical protein F4821DRAFT_68281 [Hypoxylon rubiginosum]
MMAILGAIIGLVVERESWCTLCMEGLGRFQHCIVVPGQFRNSCVSCHYASVGKDCSVRPDVEKLVKNGYSPVSNIVRQICLQKQLDNSLEALKKLVQDSLTQRDQSMDLQIKKLQGLMWERNQAIEERDRAIVASNKIIETSNQAIEAGIATLLSEVRSYRADVAAAEKTLKREE